MNGNPVTLYIYAEGELLRGFGVASGLIEDLELWLRTQNWKYVIPQSVFQREPACRYLGSTDLPLWEVGANAALPADRAQWDLAFPEIERLLAWLTARGEGQRLEFVVGAFDSTTGVSDDLDAVCPGQGEFSRLRQILLGEAPAEEK